MNATVQTITADRYELSPHLFSAGTRGSVGVSRMQFELSSDWEGLTTYVVFFPRRGSPVNVPYLGEPIDIPAEIMAYAGVASYVLSGVAFDAESGISQKVISLTGNLKVEFTQSTGSGNTRKVTPDTYDLFLGEAKEYMKSVLRAAQDSGAFDGVSVESVEQTYRAEGDEESNIITVVLQDGKRFPFYVKNGSKGKDGRGIDRIERTSGDGSAGSADEYTIYYTDGSTFKFTVVNGGSAGEGGAVYVLEEGETLSDVPEEYDLAYDPYAEEEPEPENEYITQEQLESAVEDALTEAKESGAFKGDPGAPGDPGVTPHIGANGNWYIGETDTGVKAQGEPGAKGDDYVLTDDDKAEIAEQAAALVDTALLSAIGSGVIA